MSHDATGGPAFPTSFEPLNNQGCAARMGMTFRDYALVHITAAVLANSALADQIHNSEERIYLVNTIITDIMAQR